MSKYTPKSTIPGLKAQHVIVTPACRSGRGVEGAIDEALRRIREEYLACINPDTTRQRNSISFSPLSMTTHRGGSVIQQSMKPSSRKLL